MDLLLHICCAHCLDKVRCGFQSEFGEALSLYGYFYNPNIHPLLEFRKRLKAVKVLNERLKLPIVYDEEYGVSDFLRECWAKGELARCRLCYRQRLVRAAREARRLGVAHFSSTLCVSQHQNHDWIRAAGEEAGQAEGVTFLYRDMRTLSCEVPKRSGIYSQQYCGCIFSEEERYRDTRKELYRGSG
ncbi:MAG: epoxyqueuosine reductase QueH [Planctomycetota bacterium]